MNKLISSVSRRLSSVEVKILLREAYETLYGIANHDSVAADDVETIFGLVLKRWSEDSVGPSRLCERMDIFLNKRVFEKTGVSWERFLERPIADNDLMIERVDASMAGENQSAATIKKILDENNK